MNDHGVKYLVIGGWALAAHGYNRLTQDFDVWIEASVENAKRVQSAIYEFIGVEPTQEQILAADKFLRMGVPPYRVEILNSIAGVVFGECYLTREPASLGGVDTYIIDIDHLIKNKLAAGRPKDIADVSYLEKIKARKKR